MWRWTRHHAFALGVLLGLLLCPRPAWDALRLGLLGWLERLAGGTRASSAAGSQPEHAGPQARCESCAYLRAQLLHAEAERAELVAALARLGALREAVPARAVPHVVLARVLGGAAAAAGAARGALDRGGRLRIDAGLEAGLAPGDPVTAGSALLGRLAAVAPDRSEVLLATAPAFRVRARILEPPGGASGTGGERPADPGACPPERAGEGPDGGRATGPAPEAPPPLEGIARGDGQGALRFRPDGTAAPRPGDRVVVSPRSEVAPAGLLLGTVVEVEVDPRTRAVEATLAPAVPLQGLDEVEVLLRQPAARQLATGPDQLAAPPGGNSPEAER
ncbi:MAG: hypothetical protein KatS3mg102_1702 [Planctomycetota bacterium]|nr:MAG: hypothetical protein KatS3mg102_1702 [Planctomycetota bacterium]